MPVAETKIEYPQCTYKPISPVSRSLVGINERSSISFQSTNGAGNIMVNRIVCPPIEELDRLRQPLTKGEKRVLEYFDKTLPLSWEIYVQPHMNGLRPDFVLLHPKNGIAVYEVKDWDLDAMEYFASRDKGGAPRLMARQNGHAFSLERDNPVQKIQLYKDEIYSLYCPRLPSKSGFGTIVAGIVFPFAEAAAVERLFEPFRRHYGHDKHKTHYPIIARESLERNDPITLKRQVLRSAFQSDDDMSDMAANDLRHWLVEPDFSVEQRRPLMIDLSASQKRFVSTRTATGYRRIKGPAGSGKTFVLAGRAAVLASEGKKVLVITFNITLINYILDMAVRFTQTGKIRDQIVALNFHAWCKRVAMITGHLDEYHALWSDVELEHVLKDDLPKAVRGWLEEVEEADRWDAILVDEGQDFELSWWQTLRATLRKEGEALLCADSTQNIYAVSPWTDEQMTGAGFRGEWGTLSESFRLSPALCQLAKSFIDQYLISTEVQRPEPQEGEFEYKTILKWWQIPSGYAAQYCVDAMIDIVKESDPPIAYADLTCIVENEDIGLDVVLLLQYLGIRAIHTFGQGETSIEKQSDGRRKKQAFFKGDARVKVTTLHSFKGWESKVLVVHIGHAETDASLALAYAGLTRLKRDDFGCYLTVVCETEKLSSFGKQWPIYLG